MELIALLAVILGAKLVSTMVDDTGFGVAPAGLSGLYMDQPFWPQFALLWVVVGLGGGLIVALGLLAWSDEAVERPGWRRAAIIAVACLVLIAGFQLAGSAHPRDHGSIVRQDA